VILGKRVILNGGFGINSRHPDGFREGRFPANLIHDNSEEVRECFPDSKSAGKYKEDKLNTFKPDKAMFALGYQTNAYAGDSGNASRFFKSIIYQAKASKSERNKGCEGLEEKEEVYPGINTFDESGNRLRADGSVIPPLKSKNNHPTVKPIALMEYLIKMVTPKGGVVLDPFAGNYEHRNYKGI
jgi:site-specific DNA-methyltransferase (adenine-specific)